MCLVFHKQEAAFLIYYHMFFYIITITSILLPLLMKNKVVALRLSLLLLFFLLGFQYELVQDWEPNIGRWLYANRGGALLDAGTGGRDIEPFFIYLLKLFKPITFFGWLIFTAALFLALLYKLMREYVPPRLYWVTIALFMLRGEFGLLFINSNRQCWSLMFSILAVLFLSEKIHVRIRFPLIKEKWTKYLFAVILIYAGSQCHSAAYAAFLLIPLYVLSNFYRGCKWLLLAIVCNIIYILKAFVDTSFLQVYLLNMSGGLDLEHVDNYIEQIGETYNNNSLYEMSCFCLIITLVCYYYRRMDQPMRFYAIAWFIGIIMYSYLPSNVARMGEYMYYYLLLVLPVVVSYFRKEKQETIRAVRPLCFSILIFYAVWGSWKQMHIYLYERWLDYVSVFEAPWWI